MCMYKKPLTGITSMHLGQAGLDLNNVYLKYHSCALTASSYIMNKFIPSQITGFYNFFQQIKASPPCRIWYYKGTLWARTLLMLHNYCCVPTDIHCCRVWHEQQTIHLFWWYNSWHDAELREHSFQFTHYCVFLGYHNNRPMVWTKFLSTSGAWTKRRTFGIATHNNSAIHAIPYAVQYQQVEGYFTWKWWDSGSSILPLTPSKHPHNVSEPSGFTSSIRTGCYNFVLHIMVSSMRKAFVYINKVITLHTK